VCAKSELEAAAKSEGADGADGWDGEGGEVLECAPQVG